MTKKHEPTHEQRKMVEAMAGYGIPHDQICVVLTITGKTLREHYRNELDRGIVIANTAVVKNLHRIACGEGREAVTAGIFWLKCRAGWSEYAPVPAPKPEPLGKKELRQLDAETAEQGTTWGDVLQKPGESMN